MKINQYTLEQMEQFILNNIEHYEDFEEYSEANYNVSLEEFKDNVEDELILDITCGTYNGATDTFTPWSDNSIIGAIILDIRGSNLYESLEDYTEGSRFIDYALTYSEVYQVFTIGYSIYVALD